jgi:hypothetical protein
MVVVERTSGPGDAVHGDSVVARFVRTRQGGVDNAALRTAGVAMDLPAVGTCVAPTEGAPSVQGRGVELLDVGPITLAPVASGLNDPPAQPAAVKSSVLVLVPHSMPDPAGVVSGVFYSSRASEVFADGARVTLRSAGGADLEGGFTTTVTAPHDVQDVQVTAIPVGLDVVWDASDVDSRDVIYVDVLAGSGNAAKVLTRCTVNDVGHAVIPQSLDDGQISVHRLHREAFRAKGVDPGEVRFDVAKIVTFHR